MVFIKTTARGNVLKTCLKIFCYYKLTLRRNCRKNMTCNFLHFRLTLINHCEEIYIMKKMYTYESINYQNDQETH